MEFGWEMQKVGIFHFMRRLVTTTGPHPVLSRRSAVTLTDNSLAIKCGSKEEDGRQSVRGCPVGRCWAMGKGTAGWPPPRLGH